MLGKESNNDEEGKTVEMYENHTPDVRKSYPRTMRVTLPSEKETIEIPLTEKKKNGIKKLKNLDQPKERSDYVAKHILSVLGDEKSERFYLQASDQSVCFSCYFFQIVKTDEVHRFRSGE